MRDNENRRVDKYCHYCNYIDIVDDLTVLSPVSDLGGGAGSVGGRLLWIVAFALWTEGSQLEVRAQDASTSVTAVPKSISPANPNTLTEKEGLLAEVERDIRADPSEAPEVVARALGISVADPIVFAGQAVQSAIHTLLRPITRSQISALILAATKARPAAVLEFVRVAVRGTPKNLHRDIVAAAVAGVPDPYSRDAQGKTLAESILDVAVKSGSGENRDELSASIDSSLGSSANRVSPVATGASGSSGDEGSIAGNASGEGFGGGGGGGSLESPLATPSTSSTPAPGPTATPVSTPIAAPTPFPTPMPTPDPTPFPIPTPTPVPVSP
jgi:cell division septation protein DedD